MRPLVVVEGPGAAVAAARRELAAAGCALVEGWRHDAGVVCVGVVEDDVGAAEALLAAVSGAGLLVHAKAPRETTDRLVDDLRRLGTVDHRVGQPATPLLTQEERELLALLAAGTTLGAAATALHISRRTADRRLASARAKLGTTTTAETVVAFGRR